MYYYFHIPFCRQKCTYCKFALTPFVREKQVQQYLEYLQKEISHFFGPISKSSVSIKKSEHGIEHGALEVEKIQSFYFGGGTPSVLSPEQIASIIHCFDTCKKDGDYEFTLEANPEDITQEWVEQVRMLGVNRISLGVQTLSEQSLQKIGRGNPLQIFAALDILKTVGIDNVNVDFILGLPYVRSGGTLLDIQKLHGLYGNIRHTSVYFLEKGDYPSDWRTLGMSEEEQCQEYGHICEYLGKIGWNHYEISNFSAFGYESRHNRAYWNHSPVRGFGLSAASFIPGVKEKEHFSSPSRFENAHTFSAYYRSELAYQEVLNEKDILLEKGMFGLRQFALREELVAQKEKIGALVAEGLIEQRDGIIFPTLTGIFVIDHIMAELL